MNIFENEENLKKYLDKYFTKEGQETLENRLKTLVKLYLDKPTYPFQAMIFGFITLKIHSKEHHEGMIDELSQILGKQEVKIEVQ